MTLTSINPANGQTLKQIPGWTEQQIDNVLQQVHQATPLWAAQPLSQRANYMRQVVKTLREQKETLAQLITQEMGKLINESRAEVEKCVLGLEYYGQQASTFLKKETIASDASHSYVTYQPLGTVLAIMPWNFPFWQVIRFAAPALMAGNTVVLKHASNVPQCALALENVFKQTDIPDNLFRTLLISASQTEKVIADKRISAVSLTGSAQTGKHVAALCGAHLKKSLLELGGSDPFIVLDDADLTLTVEQAVQSRYMNAGQSCIAAKRFIVVESIADDFIERFKEAVLKLKVGDPSHETTTLAPMARHDLRDQLHDQVQRSIEAGARVISGCHPMAQSGAYYQPSILDRVQPGMAAYDEELFGPVAAIIRANNEEQAIQIANDTDFGLGASVWTRDIHRAEKIALQLQCGCAFVNGLVKSDPRLPFGGIKKSGYGRELSHYGLKEFVNIKTLWIA